MNLQLSFSLLDYEMYFDETSNLEVLKLIYT